MNKSTHGETHVQPLKQGEVIGNQLTLGSYPSLYPRMEEDRVLALDSFHILNEEPIPLLDLLCQFAASYCNMPIAAVTLLNRHSLWLKATHGIKRHQIRREDSFCTYNIVHHEEFLVIPDTLQDPRFATNVQVTEFPFIRFYAGAPLVSAGHYLGCFCVLDTKPGSLSGEQLALIRRLAKTTVTILEESKAMKDLAALHHLEKEVYNKILLSTADLAAAAPSFDAALTTLMGHLDPSLGWLSARIRNMQTGGTTGIYYNKSLAPDPELPLIWQKIDSSQSHPLALDPHTEFISSAPLRVEYSYLCIPVRIRDRLVALLEFLYPDHRRADPRVREIYSLIAANLAIVAERELVNVELLHMAQHDPVSGAATRGRFIEQLDRTIKELMPTGTPNVILFCFDVNDFMSINDDLGYEVGVKLLREITARAEHLCKPGDFLGRLVGGEFLLLMHQNDPNEEISKLITRVSATLNGPSLNGPYLIGENEIEITMSIGCVFLTNQDVPAEELIRRAEEAMHMVKNGYGMEVCIADEEVLKAFHKRRWLDRKVKDAVRSNRLTLFYQPIVRISDESIVGAEALIRLIDLDGKIVVAEDFITALERTRLLPRVDEWVFSEVLHILKQNSSTLASVPDFYCSVNISPEIIATDTLRNRFLSLLRNEEVSPCSIHVEITEKALLPKNARVNANLKLLRDTGILIALDDFGTGYSNLSLIATHPVDFIKIDRSFLTEIVTGNKTLNSLLASITDIARNFGCKTIAEGVEDKAQALHLKSLGCDYAQGYLFGQPMPLENFINFVQSR